MLELRSNAKINLGLKVLNKRKDGYHNLHSLFLPITLFDRLEFRHNDEITVTTTIDDFVPQELNLCFKAAIALQRFTGTNQGVNIHCEKVIPMGAGLGGGSANAATTLSALKALWNIDISMEKLLSIAVTLGSDVPFFLHNTPTIVGGKGDELTVFPMKEFPYSILLVNPGIHSPTVSAFKSLGRTEDFSADIPDYNDFLHNGSFELFSSKYSLENDFEPILFAEFPILEEIKKKLRSFGADFSIMSGSGSTMLGLFSSKNDGELLQSAYQYFRDIYPSTYIVHCILT